MESLFVLGYRLSDAGNERVKMYLEGFAIDVADICALSTGVTGTYRYLLKNESISTANISCPSALQSYFTYSADFGSNDTCSGNTTQFDGCTSSTALSYNYSVIDTSSTSTIYATQYPQQCQDNQTSTYVQAAGAALIFTYNDMIYSSGLEPVTPSGVYPRTMDDRANKEERMSCDSALGMEEDYIPPLAGTPEVRTNHEVKAFRKVHGRQQFKSEAALVNDSNPMNLVKKIKKLAKKKKRKPSEIYQSPDPVPQSVRSDPNYVMGIGNGAEADRGRDAKRRDTHPDVNSSSRVQPMPNTNFAYDDQVDKSAIQSGKRFKQDEDVSKLLAGTVLNDVDASSRTNHQQRRRKPSKGVHYSPRSPGVIMEDLEDQVSKKYTEGYLSPVEQEHPDSNAANSVNNKANAYIYTEDDKNGTRDRVSVTPGMKIRRYENSGDGMDPNESSTLSARNQSNYIQRLNRKTPKRMSSNRLTKSAGSPSLPELQRRGMTDDKYRKLLEELYPDKKYFDYTKDSAGPSEEYLSNKTNEGLEYLHGCAEYWENHESPQRPQSTPSKSKGSKSARGQTTTRISSGLSRNHSIHTLEVTSEGFPPNVS
ncbi:uncharacterized protein LOC126829762 [Patella vulgata]|uniref:uncharacterized protein LOC126829762 n=1 Tax=Patella vulgata TaxID=6465 RepID=UPI0024A7C1DD|nr:uncharacterized protein LOC126829762 [Patella vulgata]